MVNEHSLGFKSSLFNDARMSPIPEARRSNIEVGYASCRRTLLSLSLPNNLWELIYGRLCIGRKSSRTWKTRMAASTTMTDSSKLLLLTLFCNADWPGPLAADFGWFLRIITLSGIHLCCYSPLQQ